MNGMVRNKKVPQAQPDRRAAHYQEGVRAYAQQFPSFHRQSAEVLYNLVYTYDVVAARLAARLSEDRLSLSAFNILTILYRSGAQGRPLHELGELLLVSRANVTGLVDSLERRGLVERSLNKSDRRVRLAQITQAGTDLLGRILPIHFAEVRQVCAGLTNKEKKTLTELLMRLRNEALTQATKRSKTKEG